MTMFDASFGCNRLMWSESVASSLTFHVNENLDYLAHGIFVLNAI